SCFPGSSWTRLANKEGAAAASPRISERTEPRRHLVSTRPPATTGLPDARPDRTASRQAL
ncbi:hypothetical protein ACSTGZ_23375, partial [Vibrio parahaemolyticus]